MDWNKSNTILIVAFLIVNIFLFGFTYFGDFFEQRFQIEEKEEFIQNVKDTLKLKNITLTCEVPSEVSEAPFLDIKYDIIYPTKELVESFIGVYNDTINNEIKYYENNNESLEIVGSKRIIYNNKNVIDTEIKNTENVDNIINSFCEKKNIDLSDFSKVYESDVDDYRLVRFVQKYKGFNLENAYMHFYIKDNVVFKFELQKVVSIKERASIKSISAAEALLRLMTFDSIANKEIVDIELCYYTNEDKDFESINSIDVDQVWKVIFSDNCYVYLIAEDY